MGVVKNVSAAGASLFLNTSGVDLLQSDLVSTNIGGGFFFPSSSKCLNFLKLQLVIIFPNLNMCRFRAHQYHGHT